MPIFLGKQGESYEKLLSMIKYILALISLVFTLTCSTPSKQSATVKGRDVFRYQNTNPAKDEYLLNYSIMNITGEEKLITAFPVNKETFQKSTALQRCCGNN